ncbi:hypothetical protein I4U23_002372 [Adineta vaga]|nr:hypothetical protein I4U23_002372 [Adineta vaga]
MSTSKNQQQQSLNRHVIPCTRCSLSFSNQKAYHEHLRSHMPTHKINVSNQTSESVSADETARYIAERRKNYPTADNINKKMKSEEERQERGDILETRQFGRMKERKTIPNRNIDTGTTSTSVITTTLTNNTNATLLERLLASDIRRERNMVLQCIRHIVNNNFYGLDHQ